MPLIPVLAVKAMTFICPLKRPPTKKNPAYNTQTGFYAEKEGFEPPIPLRA